MGRLSLGRLARALFARRVAIVPQMEKALFPFRAVETVLMGRTPWIPGFGFESAEDLRIARDCLLAVGAAHLAERDLTELSGGELQRVLLARALAQNTELGAVEIAERALRIAAEICIYTNDRVTLVQLP